MLNLKFFTVKDNASSDALKEAQPRVCVKWGDLETNQWKATDVLLTSGNGYPYVFPENEWSPRWFVLWWIQPGQHSGDLQTKEASEDTW